MKHVDSLFAAEASWRSAARRSVLGVAVVLLALSAAGCGRTAHDTALRSEGSKQQPRSVGLGVRAAPTPRRCLAAARWTATPDHAYAAVVRTTATAYARGPGSPVIGRFEHFDVNGFPTVFSILGARLGTGCEPAWYHVRLSVRPNGTTGWVRAGAVGIYPVRSRVIVDLSARRLVAYRDGRPVLRARVAIGSAQTPTPTGRFFVNERFVLSDPNGPFGVAALGVSAHSTVLRDWVQGGPIALHGTNDPASIGSAVSHGCVRLANTEMRRLLALAPAGTPVVIRR